MLHINLSENLEPTDLIIWSEAALVVPDDIPQVKSELLKMLNSTNAILITGGIWIIKNKVMNLNFTQLCMLLIKMIINYLNIINHI